MNTIAKSLSVFAIILTTTIGNVFSSYYDVTNTNDSGPGSLRQAIIDANTNLFPDYIRFNIPLSDPNYNATSGTFLIELITELPALTDDVTQMYGVYQTTSHGDTNPYGPEIVISGSLHNIDVGLKLITGGHTIEGLCIGGFNIAIQCYGNESSGIEITGNYIGVSADGLNAFPNHYGIWLGGEEGTSNAAHSNYILNNVISGNTQYGVALLSAGNIILNGNLIGVNSLGNAAIPNTDGIIISSAMGNFIGNDYENRNVISGNLNAGIILENHMTQGNEVKFNRIGTDLTGTLALGNKYGIIIRSEAWQNYIGGEVTASGNIISANTDVGVLIEDADENYIFSNFIGPDATGNSTFLDSESELVQDYGIYVSDGSQLNQIGNNTNSGKNIISGNGISGVYLTNFSEMNYIKVNFIGTNSAGNASLPNTTGVHFQDVGMGNFLENCLISGNTDAGVWFSGEATQGNVITAGKIGLDQTGTYAIPNNTGVRINNGASFNNIGGYTTPTDNVISGNTESGIEISDLGTNGNIISNNYIGTDISGNVSIPNNAGVCIYVGSGNSISECIISGNNTNGIRLSHFAEQSFITLNKIGLGADGIIILGNGENGILIDDEANNNIIGGDLAGNIISGNYSNGILIKDESASNWITQNSIYNNTLLGIDIYPLGINLNDEGDLDSGPNMMMNYPIITSAIFDENTNLTTISGTINTIFYNNCKIEIFKATPGTEIENNGEAISFLGKTNADVNSNWSISVNGLIDGDFITATASDFIGNTSEFAINFTTITRRNESQNINEFSIYPNPCQGYFSIFSYNLSDISHINITDVNGSIVKTFDQNNYTSLNSKFDINGLTAGLYFVNIIFESSEIKSLKIFIE